MALLRAVAGAGAPDWPGVDQAVVERFAAEAGRAPRAPLLQGDLLLFAFLLAGIVGGFALGYTYRLLFVERPPRAPHAE